MAEGCQGTQYLERVGHRSGVQGLHLDLEEVLLRCLAILKVQTPDALGPTRWEARIRHRCDRLGCNFQSLEIPTVASRNPIMMTPQLGELADALRDSLHRQDTAPHPCPSCSRDASLTSVGDTDLLPPFLICHLRRGHGPSGGQWNWTRVKFTDRIEVRRTWYRLQSFARYTGPSDRPG